MDNEGLFDMMDGASDVQNRNLFKNECTAIQIKYDDWFKSRPGIFEHQHQDELSNHINGSNNSDGKKVIGFWDESELPEYIKNEIREAANRCFN